MLVWGGGVGLVRGGGGGPTRSTTPGEAHPSGAVWGTGAEGVLFALTVLRPTAALFGACGPSAPRIEAAFPWAEHVSYEIARLRRPDQRYGRCCDEAGTDPRRHWRLWESVAWGGGGARARGTPPKKKTNRALLKGGVSARWARAGHLFLTIPHLCLFLPLPHQTIWSAFSPCLRILPILCTHFMMMARVLVVGSGGSDILCC